MLPLRSFFVALLFVLIPAIANKLAAAPGQTHYFGDHQRRSLDGSLRHDPYTDLSASPAYRARPHERVMQPYAATYDGVPLMAPITFRIAAMLTACPGVRTRVATEVAMALAVS